MKLSAIVLALLLPLTPTFPAFAAAERFLYQGDIQLLELSGGSCGDSLKQGALVHVDLVVRVDTGRDRERIEGYLASPATRTVRFAGDDRGQLVLYHPDAAGSTVQGVFSLGDLRAGQTVGLVQERHLPEGVEGCNVDRGRVSLTRSLKGGEAAADSLWQWFGTRFRAEAEFAGGYALFRSGRLTDAVPRLEAAVKLREELDKAATQELIRPVLYLGVSKAALGSYDEGFRLIERVSRIPARGRTSRQLEQYAVDLMCSQAVALYDDGKQELSLSLSRQILAHFPDNPHAVISNAGIMMADGELEQACRLLDASLFRHPESGELRRELAGCLQKNATDQFDSDDPSVSIALYRRALALKPGDKESLDGLLAAFSAQGTPADGYRVLEENSAALVSEYGREKLDNGYAFLGAEEAKLAESTGELARAEALLRKAIDLSPEDVSHTVALARLLHKAGRFPDVVRLLDERGRRCRDDSCRGVIAAAGEREAMLEKLLQRLDHRR